MELKRAVNTILGWYGLRIVRLKNYDSEKDPRYTRPSYSDGTVPATAMEYLSPENPKLKELRSRYASMQHPAGMNPDWTERRVNTDIDLKHFRGDNAYVYQYRSVGSDAELKYLLYAYYISRLDRMELLNRIEEDGLFGAYTFNFNDRLKVSKDLLDSISQIYFLEDSLGLSQMQDLRIIDIGAGYGRLAHRMVQSLHNIGMYYCVDGVAESTFLCDFYIAYRGLTEKAISVPLFEIEQVVRSTRINLAINIHSFSQCPLSVITWWLDLIRHNQVKYLFLVPNSEPHDELLSSEINGTRCDYSDAIHKRGYRLLKKAPKFQDSSLQKLFHVRSIYYYLFELAE